jgi:hypothetical protein
MRKLLTGACVALLIMVPDAAQAQIGLGGQLNIADDADLGIGVRGTFPLPTTMPLEIIGSFDYFFPSTGVAGIDVDYWELNANIVYVFPIPSTTVAPYAGTGLNYAHASVSVPELPGMSVSNSDVGLNILGGAKFKVGQVTPFGEFRVELGGGEEFVITGGVMMTVGR